MNKKALLIANGYPPSKSVIKKFQKLGYDFLVGVDGGNNYLKRLNITPDLIVGDLDSIDSQILHSFSKVTKVVKLKRQDDTDVEKALKYLIKHKFTDAILFGGTGNRLDHSIANLGFVLKYFEKIKISLIHHNSILTPYVSTVELNCQRNELISLYTFSPQTKISSVGLKYKLNKTSLMFGIKDSTSNVAVKNKVTLEINDGVAFVIRDLKMVLQNGII